MRTIFFAVCVLFVGLALGLIIGAQHFGAIFAVPFLILMLCVWMALEVWTHKYISSKGILTRIEVADPEH
jgi:hypothetical protein